MYACVYKIWKKKSLKSWPQVLINLSRCFEILWESGESCKRESFIKDKVKIVSLPESSHGDNGVPKSSGNGGEIGVFHIFLSVEHNSGENDDGHGQWKNEKAQFGGARLESVAQDPESLRMTRELEDSKYAENSKGDESSGHVIIVRDPQPDIVGKNCHHVNDAHHAADELAPVGCGEQTEKILCREYHDTRRVQAEKHRFVALPAWERAPFPGQRPTRHRLHHVGHHRHGDEEARHVVKDEGGCGRVRIFKGPPHALSDICDGWALIPIFRQLIIQEALRIFPLSVPVVFIAAVSNDVRQNTEKCEFFVVARETLVFGIVKLPGPVVIENVTEYVGVPVKKVLPGVLIIKKVSLRRA